MVIGTEHEPAKAAAARANFPQAALRRFIDLREGDLRETLRDVGGPVDPCWSTSDRDRTAGTGVGGAPISRGRDRDLRQHRQYRKEYADYFAFLNDPAHGFRTTTLPLFDGGLEFSVRCWD